MNQKRHPRFCRHCGTSLNPGVAFCRQCGQRVISLSTGAAPPSTAVRPDRAKGFLLYGMLAVIGMCVLGGGLAIVWLGFSIPEPPVDRRLTGEPDPRPETLPQASALRLEHPSGATGQIPAGPALYPESGDSVKLSDLDIPWENAHSERIGPVWQMTSQRGIPFDEPVSLDLPASGQPGEAVVMLTPIGAWVPVSSIAASLEGGGAARRLNVSGVPTPWRFAVVVPKADSEPPEMNDVVRLEALYLTEREAWAQETRDWLATGGWQQASDRALPSLTMASLTGGRTSAVRPLAQEREWNDVEDDLEETFMLLGAVRLATSYTPAADVTAAAFGTTLPGLEVTGFQLYVIGVNRLAELRNEWVLNRDRWSRESGIDVRERLFDSSQTTEQAMESALYSYAPWGVEATRYLLRSGSLNGLDLRVVQPYGDLHFADVPVGDSREMRNEQIEEDIENISRGSIGRPEVRQYLRLYSQSAIEDTSWIDWLKDWRTETAVRWLPAGLAAAGVIPGGATVPVLFAIADEALNFMQSYYESSDGNTYAQYQYGSAVLSAYDLTLSVNRDVVRLAFEPGYRVPASTKVSYVQAAYSVGLLYAVTHTDWYMLKDVRQMNEGTRGYCLQGRCPWFTSSVIPPIQTYAVIRGDPWGHPAGAYPAMVTQLAAWQLPFANRTFLAQPDLHELFLTGSSTEDSVRFYRTERRPTSGELRTLVPWSGLGLYNLHTVPYKKDLWPEFRVVVRTNPHAQAIRIAIPAAELKRIQTEYRLGPAPGFEEYGLVLRLEAPDGSRTVHKLTQPTGQLKNEDGEWVYVAAVLRQRGIEEFGAGWLSGYDLPTTYDGDQQEAPGGELRTHLEGRLLVHGSDVMSFELDFTGAHETPIWRIDDDDPDSPLVQYADVEMELHCEGVVFHATVMGASGKLREYGFVLMGQDQMVSVTEAAKGAPLTPEEIDRFTSDILLQTVGNPDDRAAYKKAVPSHCYPSISSGDLLVLYHGIYTRYGDSEKVLWQAEFDRGQQLRMIYSGERDMPQGTNPLSPDP